MGQATVSSLKKKADAIFSKYIRYRDGEQRTDGWWTECITCGTWKPSSQMQAGHFVSRKVNSLRYTEINVNGQCYSCNVMRYGEQFQYAKNLDLKYGDNTANELHRRRFETHKFTIPELEVIIEEYKQLVKEIEDANN